MSLNNRIKESIRNNYIFTFLEYIFIILTILQYGSVYSSLQNRYLANILPLSWHLLIVILLSILMVYINNYKIANFNTNFLALFIVYFMYISFLIVIDIIHYHITDGVIQEYVINPLLIMILLCAYSRCKLINSLLYKFENVIMICAIVSLFFWILNLLHFPTNVTCNTLWGSITGINQSTIKSISGYYYVYFVGQGYTNFLGINFLRNTGIFMEAPIYSNELCIALFIELFIKKNNNVFNFKTIILLLTILSTASTTGLLVAIPSLFYKLILINKRNRIYLIFIPFVLLILYLILTSKLSNISEISSSSIRANDFSSTIQAWLQHIFVGNGIDNNMSIIKKMAPWRTLMNGGGTFVSIGFTRKLAYGGLLLGLLYIIPLIVSYLTSYKLFGFCSFIFVIFIFNDITSYIFTLILMYIWIMFVSKYRKEKIS